MSTKLVVLSILTSPGVACEGRSRDTVQLPSQTAGTTGAAGTFGTAGTGSGAAGTLGAVGTGIAIAGSGATGSAGSVADAGLAGAAGAAGTGGTAGVDGGGGWSAGNGPNTARGFMNLAPALGAPLDPQAAVALTPAPPAGWSWFPIDGTQCRDGSATGLFVRFTQSDKLLIFLEGGGACSSPGFCNFNPASHDQLLTGDGQTVLGTAFGVIAKRQEPGAYEGGVLRGVFDRSNARNPFKDWNQIYIPYCTGDVYGGTRANVMLPGVSAPQQFVGHLNMQKMIGRIVPTFADEVNQVVLTGVSAGSFGTALNFSMVQDAFGDFARVFPLLDSGLPFSDEYWPPCLQKRFRETWGLDAMLPPDCTQCFDADGGGLLGLAEFLMEKHPNATLAAVSTLHDEVIRLFFSAGLSNCANYETADPVGITLVQFDPNVYMTAAHYEAAVFDTRRTYEPTGRLATYVIGGPMSNVHQHIFRDRFFEPLTGGKTIADFVQAFLNDEILTLAP